MNIEQEIKYSVCQSLHDDVNKKIMDSAPYDDMPDSGGESPC